MIKVPKSYFIIEIGSGGNPTPKSDVLVEPYLDGEHETSKAVLVDRPTFVMTAEKLPFKNKAFDYSICFHVLEHTSDPKLFIDTLSRISNAGYIETPTPLNELLFPYDFHMTAVSKTSDNSLRAFGLSGLDEDSLKFFRESITSYISHPAFLKFYRKNPELFNTVLRWRNNITIEMVGVPKQYSSFSEYKVPDHPHHEKTKGLKQKITPIIRKIFRTIAKKKIDILSLLECPECKKSNINQITQDAQTTSFICTDCNEAFLESRGNIFRLIDHADKILSINNV